MTFFQSGFPFSVVTGRDIAGTGTFIERPDRICDGDMPGEHRSVDRWFDTSCFTTQLMEAAQLDGHPRFGNAGRNIVDEPGWNVWDINLYKDNYINERFRTQLRFEFYTSFNHAHFQRPSVIVVTSGYGQITAQPNIGHRPPKHEVKARQRQGGATELFSIGSAILHF